MLQSVIQILAYEPLMHLYLHLRWMQNQSVYYIQQFFWHQKIFIEKIFETSDLECWTTFSLHVGQPIIRLIIIRYFKKNTKLYLQTSNIGCWHWYGIVCSTHHIFYLMDKISQQASSMMLVKHCHDLCIPLVRNLYSTW